jgi:SAM-dependent methyltransferase
MDKYIESFYPESYFGGFTQADGTVAFYSRVNVLIEPSFVLVDFGCGRGQHAEDAVSIRRRLQCFKGRVAKVIGLDVDSAGQTNPTIDEFRKLAPDQDWPVADKSANLVLCDSVLEHLAAPEFFFKQARRVLVEGGYLCIRTTNVLSYVGIGSRLVPNRLHSALLSRLQGSRKEEDVFPTLYRCNTIRSIRRQMRAHGFRAAVYGHTHEPNYLRFSKLAYALGVLHQRWAPGAWGLTIFAFGQLLA